MKVIPGTSLGYQPSDGYTAGNGTFMKDDMIYASKLGAVNVIKNIVSIGSVVDTKMRLFLGKIVKINASKATITIYVDFDNQKLALDVNLLEKDSGRDNLLQYFKLGDILQIRLLSNIYDENVYCTTIGSDVGVVLANCSDCFAKLSIVSQDSMFCSSCKNIEKRKCVFAS
jgi:exosome complex RNA-binding protein Csl4